MEDRDADRRVEDSTPTVGSGLELGSGSRLARWRGILGLAVRRTATRAVWTERQQVGLSVIGIAAAIALMLLVTSVGFGLETQTAAQASGVDYMIVPEAGASSAVTDVAGTRLGAVHRVSQRLTERPDVAYATPILIEPMGVATEDGGVTSVLVIGVIPAPDHGTIVGLSTAALTPGDPYFDNGSYDGTWTGEVVLSESAAEAIGAQSGDRLDFGGAAAETPEREFVVVNVSAPHSAGLGQFPVAMVHLSELQSVSGASDDDQADQLLVDATTRESEVKTALEAVYPNTVVLAHGDVLGRQSVRSSQLPLAISLASLIVAVAVGTLFMMTTMGFELAADSRWRAVLAVLGFSGRSRSALVAVQALLVAVAGGILGVGLWLVGGVVVNFVTRTYVTDVPIALLRPEFAAYGLGVAFVIGLLTLPYLVVMSRRTLSFDRLTP